MSNKIKDVDITNHTHYFFNDIINIKIFDPNRTGTDKNSCKNIHICCIGYVRSKFELREN